MGGVVCVGCWRLMLRKTSTYSLKGDDVKRQVGLHGL
jgi:hypothetical protein